MNSLINRLNPKTTQFDAAGTGASVGSITAADVCIAISYAKLSPVRCELVRLKCLNEATPARVSSLADQLMAHFADAFRSTGMQLSVLKSCIVTALAEFCLVPATYKPSGRNRALFIGIGETTYRRHNLAMWVDKISSQLAIDYADSMAQLSDQLNTLKASSN